MELEKIGINEKKIKQFTSVGVESVEALIALWPKDYIDRTKLTGLLPDAEEESRVILQVKTVQYCSSRIPKIEARCQLPDSGEDVVVIWWNSYVWDEVKNLRNKEVLFCGKAKSVSFNGYKQSPYCEITNPEVYSADLDNAARIYPVYRNIKGMSKAYHQKSLQAAYQALCPMEDTLPEWVRSKHNLMDFQQAVYQRHWPESATLLEQAQRRLMWDELFYFAARIELNNRSMAQGSPFHLPSLQSYRKVISSLPFELTKDQQATLSSILDKIQSGKRINALIQGDVGTGKTIVAFLLMIAFAGNGYQAALMAPTQILALQHYKNLVNIAEPLGYKVAFISGDRMKKAEKKAMTDGLESGKIRLIVGTQALLSQGIRFQKLALCVTDEEHRYGVNQRNDLVKKAAEGVHSITMTATPIPRTLAQTIYGSKLDLYSIQTKPAGRKPVITGIAKNMDAVFKCVHDTVSNGEQVYVVCPMIDSNDKLEGVDSVETIYKIYRNALEALGIRIGVVTGRMKKTETAQVLSAFESGDLDVLIATTVIEVGVNVPRSTLIIIHNAERFGLSQLHQLRGRVGRSDLQSVCCLVSEHRDNERLQVLCQTNDGFEIAEADLRLRGAGDFLGTAQSGNERHLQAALSNPDLYKQAQEAAEQLLRSGETCALIDLAITDRDIGKEGEMLEQ